MKFEYTMVQIPQDIKVSASKQKGNEAAIYLETLVRTHAANGWEFFRIDPIGVLVEPGCLSGLLGQKIGYQTFHVVTFRREVG